MSLVSYLLQPAFINWSLLAPFYALIAFSMGMHLVFVSYLEKLFNSPKILFATFVVDSILISGLIYYSGSNQSLFLFLHLINILLAGLIYRTNGALVVALITSVLFSTVSIFGPELKAIHFLFMLAFNNIAFFLIAGLSGYLSEQLYETGIALEKTGLSLRSQQELNKVIVENIPSGLISFRETGIVLQANAAAEEIMNMGDLVGQNIFNILSGFAIQAVGETQKLELKYQSKNETDPKILGLVATSVYSDTLGGPVRIALIEDLTKIKKLEYSLRQHEKLSAVGQLAAGIAHEIRNPLSSISGSVELLSQTATNEDDKKLMNIILREINRLNGLITEFLEYARPEKPPTDVVNLSELITELVNSMSLNKTLKQDVQVIRQIDEKVEILAHRDKLKQAFLNILINSYQAMSDTLRPVLDVSLSQDDLFVVMKIKDNGCGMTEATKKRMFEPFHTTKVKGTGLGLAITHKIFEGHQAQISVESTQGQGTEFTIKFPMYKKGSV